MRCADRALRALALVCALALPSAASAQDVQAAAAAFGEGQRAQLSGEFARAAELFELADQAAPSPEARRSAIRNHRAAGQLARAATLSASALELYPDDAETRALADEVLVEARARLGAARVSCEPACALVFDGRAASSSALPTIVLFAEPGAHRVVASWPDGRESTQDVELSVGTATEVRLVPPEPEPSEPEPPAAIAPEPEPETPEPATPRRGGVTPAVFGIGVAITAFGLGLTTWSGVETLTARDRYVENPTRAGYENGVTLEWRTNGLLFGTLAVGVTAAILALFTDFGGDGALVAVAPTPGGAYALIGGTFDGSAW